MKSGNSDQSGQAGDKIQVDQMSEFQQLSETFTTQELESLLRSQERQQLDDQVSHGIKGHQNQSLRVRNSSANLDSSIRLQSFGSAPPLGFYQNVSLLSYLSGVATAEHYSISSSDLTLRFGSFSLRQICEYQVFYNRHSWNRLEGVHVFATTFTTLWKLDRKLPRKFYGDPGRPKTGVLGGYTVLPLLAPTASSGCGW